MALSRKVKSLNFFREVFKVAFLEKVLCSLTEGKSPHSFLSKLVPNPYQYLQGSIRTLHRNGLKMQVDISDYIGHYLYFGFKDEDIEKLYALCQEGSNVLDIGTNIGWVAHNLARISKSGSVLGFEPDPYNYDRCLENIKLNSLKNLHVYPVGLGAANTRVGMEIRTPSNLGGNRIAPAAGNATTRTVEIKKLDDFEPAKALRQIHLIKIDVEGYELNVLRGAENTIAAHHPIFFIELDDNNLRDQGDSASSLVEFLASRGYTKIVNVRNGEAVSPKSDFKNCHYDILAR